MTLNVNIEELGGYCPVQGHGTVDGKEFYFRARGNSWTMGIGGDVVGNPDWSIRQPYGTGDFDAGYMDMDEARAFIHQAAGQYLAEQTALSALSAPEDPG
jgi:hypothetical protein